MSGSDEYFDVQNFFDGKGGIQGFLEVQVGDIVKVIEKDFVYYTVEKGGKMGKVPKWMLKKCESGSISTQGSSCIGQKGESSKSSLPYVQPQSFSEKQSQINQQFEIKSQEPKVEQKQRIEEDSKSDNRKIEEVGSDQKTDQLQMIIDIMQKLIKGTEQEKNQTRKDKENGCLKLVQILKGDESQQLRENVTKSGIAEKLDIIFQRWEFSNITVPFIEAFFYITEPQYNKIGEILIKIEPYYGLVKILKHTDNKVVEFAICSLRNILEIGLKLDPKNQQHPQYIKMTTSEKISTVAEVFKQTKNISIANNCALVMGLALRGNSDQFGSSGLKNDVINRLRSIADDSNRTLKNLAIQTLEGLNVDASDLEQLKRNDTKGGSDQDEEDDEVEPTFPFRLFFQQGQSQQQMNPMFGFLQNFFGGQIQSVNQSSVKVAEKNDASYKDVSLQTIAADIAHPLTGSEEQQKQQKI